MFLCAIAFLIGNVLVQACPTLPQPVPVMMAASAGLFVVILLIWRKTRRFGLLALGVALGVVWSAAHAYWQLAHDLTDDASSTKSFVDVVLVGDVSSLVAKTSYGSRFEFDVVSVEGAARDRFPQRVELTWYDTPPDIGPGERWRLPVRLKPRHGFANPGGFDYEAQLFSEGIGATGYVKLPRGRKATSKDFGKEVGKDDIDVDVEQAKPMQMPSAMLRFPVLRTRAWLSQRLALGHANDHSDNNSVDGSEAKFIGIVQGLSVGDTSAISSEQWRVFARTGTTHLMAISGLHIAMVAFAVAALVGWCIGVLPLQRWGASRVAWQSMAGLSTAVIYSALAGFSIPTQRTLVMLCIFFLLKILRRSVSLLHGFGLALICVLVIDPFAPLSAGFWLSFGAVAAIMLSASGRISLPKKLIEYLRLQWSITIGMLPLVIFAFGGVSVVAPLVNLIVIPLFSFVAVPLALLATMLAAIHPSLAHWPLVLFDALFGYAWPALQWAAHTSVSMWQAPTLPLGYQVLLLLGCVLVIAPGVVFTRAVGLLLMVTALLWQPVRPRNGEFELALLDVGQGLSVVIQTHQHTVLYDTGPAFRSGRDTGELVVLPFLYANGVHHIDNIIASHGDADHIGGLQSVLNAMPAPIFAGPSVPMQFMNRSPCLHGQQWSYDEVRFEILYPISIAANAKDNDSSCVLRVSGVGGSAIIFGDIERVGEQALLAAHEHDLQNKLRSDIAIVPHHGSRTSSSKELIAATQARYALIGVGADNRWGFPKADVVERWRDAGASIYSTDASGAIQIQVARDGIQVPQEHREQRQRYWRR